MNRKNRLDKTSATIESPGASLTDRVYHHVTDQILNGHWVSGEVIDRKRVASELKVSLAPVSEALIRLTGEGFLETSPRRHTRVRVIRKEDVRGQFVLRLALERQAVLMVHGEPVRKARVRLIELAKEVDRFRPKKPEAWPAEIAFHQALADLSDCPALSASLERVLHRNFFFSINSAHVPIYRAGVANNQHSKLVEALCTDDPEEADRAIMAHHAKDIQVLLRRDDANTKPGDMPR